MRTAETKLSREEALSRIHKIVEELHVHLKKHSSKNALDKIEEDIKIFEDDEMLKALLSKFDYTGIFQFFRDASNLGEIAKSRNDLIPVIKEKLRKIEKLLDEMKKDEANEINIDRFLARTAHHLSKKVRKIDGDIDKIIRNIQKQVKNDGTQKK